MLEVPGSCTKRDEYPKQKKHKTEINNFLWLAK